MEKDTLILPEKIGCPACYKYFTPDPTKVTILGQSAQVPCTHCGCPNTFTPQVNIWNGPVNTGNPTHECVGMKNKTTQQRLYLFNVEWRTNEKFPDGEAVMMIDWGAGLVPVEVNFCPLCGVKLTPPKQ